MRPLRTWNDGLTCAPAEASAALSLLAYVPILPSVFQATVVKCRQRAFQDIHDSLIDAGILDGPGEKIEIVFAVLLVDGDMNDLLGVGHDRQIGVVCHEDDLPSFLRLLDEGDKNLVPGCGAKRDRASGRDAVRQSPAHARRSQ